MKVDIELEPDAVHTRADFAAALRRLREGRGLTVRELARRLDVPSGTLGDYFSGRHVPSVAQLPLLRALLRECGVTDESEVAAWVDALHRARGASDRRVARPPAPYRGLAGFEPDDAELFFGRAEETAHILGRLRALRADPGPSGGLLAVIGPSGSGKSSLLRAGVVAAIRAGRLDGPDGAWTTALMTPGTAPLPALAAALQAGPGPHVVVVDQLEELFTSVPDAAGRAAFLDAVTARDPDVLVVLGMRADFYAAAAREPVLLPALQHAQVLVGPLTAEHVREVIVRPAAQVGATVEDGLVDLVLADLAPHGAAGSAHDAGALPLLSHALLTSWERGTGNRLTIADYRASGGIDGAVQRTAEELFGTLGPAEQTAARRLFVRLVHLDDDVALTRRRVGSDELAQLDTDGAGSVRTVVDRFVEGRLVTAGRTSVEISHEALLSAWPRLRGWIDADRAGLRLHRRLTEAAGIWQEAGHDPALLLRGARLESAAGWAADGHRPELTVLERDYLDASSAHAEDEARRDRRRTRRLQGSLLVAAVLAVVAALLSVYAFSAESAARAGRASARAARDEALSRQVAIQARQLGDADVAEQLALAGYRIAPTDQARSALVDASAAPLLTRVLGAAGPTPLALSPDGRLVAVGHADDGSVHLYAVRPGRPPAPRGVLRGGGPNTQRFALAFTPDGRILATGGQGKQLRLWNVADPAHPAPVATLLPGFTGDIQAVVISPDGRSLVAASAGPQPIVRYDLTTPAAPRPLAPPRLPHAGTLTVTALAFDRAGRTLAAGDADGTLFLWPAATAAGTDPALGIAATPGSRLNALQFDPDGTRLAAGYNSGAVVVWSTAAPKPAVAQRIQGSSTGQINVLAFSPDGTHLAFGSSDSTVTVRDAAGRQVLTTITHEGPVTGLVLGPDGRTGYSTAADGTLRVWPVVGPGVPVTGTVFTAAYSADGSRLLVTTNGPTGGARLYDTRTPDRPVPLGPLLTMGAAHKPIDGAGAVRPDGRLVAAGNGAGEVQLWDTRDPQRPQPVGAPFAGARALVESMAFDPAGAVLAVGSDDNSTHLWDVRDPGHPRQLAAPAAGNLVFGTAFGPRGRLLAVASADDKVHLYDVADPARPRQLAVLGGFSSYAYGVAISPDGRTLAGTSADHTTLLWDISRPQRPRRLGAALTGPTDYVTTASFSADGRLLAVSSNDHTVWVFDVRDRTHPHPYVTLRAQDSNVFAATFAPHGRYLAAGGRSPQLSVWDVDPAGYARRLCAATGSALTRVEWRQYVPGARYAPPCG